MPYVAINIPVKLLYTEDHSTRTFHVFADSLADSDAPIDGCSCYAGSLDSAKKKLRPKIESTIAEALRNHKHIYERRYLGCGDGTVLCVFYRSGWGYDIAGPGRKHCCGSSGYKDLAEAESAARNHAAQSYGGVTWEC